jgi:hypothetical protein
LHRYPILPIICLPQEDEEMKQILGILIAFVVAHAGNIKISEFKLISDSIDLPKVGINLNRNYHIEIPKNPCSRQTLRVTPGLSALDTNLKVLDIKTERLGTTNGIAYYEVYIKSVKIFEFKTEFIWGSDIIHSKYLWGNNWEIEYDDHIVVNAEELNKLYNYQKSYCFRIYNNKPIYLFEKSNRLGIKLGDNEYITKYNTALHYLCCEPAMFNPIFDGCHINIYAKRDGFWYYVTIEE